MVLEFIRNVQTYTRMIVLVYSEFFLRLAIGFYMLIFQSPVNFCPHENIQPSFVVKL
jgi:hypothetical protein